VPRERGLLFIPESKDITLCTWLILTEPKRSVYLGLSINMACSFRA
jgi:hypothetical protein